MTELRVFADQEGRFHVEISHRTVAHALRISAPLLLEGDPALQKLNPAFLIPVLLDQARYHVALASLNMEALWNPGLTQVGALDENNSRDVLNNLVDVLGY